MKFLRKFILLNMTVLFLVFSMNNSNVEALSDSKSNSLRVELLEVGVNENKVDALVEKLKNGDKLDSMKEEYDDLLPVNEYVYKGFYKAEYIYPDGSVKNVTISTGVFTGTILGGNYSSGGYWYSWLNARVFATWGVVTASFYADFQGSTNFGRIDAIRDWGIVVVGGTFNLNDFSIVRSSATSSSPAEARLFFTGTVVDGFGSATFYLRLYTPYSGPSYARLAVLN